MVKVHNLSCYARSEDQGSAPVVWVVSGISRLLSFPCDGSQTTLQWPYTKKHLNKQNLNEFRNRVFNVKKSYYIKEYKKWYKKSVHKYIAIQFGDESIFI